LVGRLPVFGPDSPAATAADPDGGGAAGGWVRACATVNLAADVGGDGRRAVQLITGVHQRAHPATEVGIIGSGDEPVMRQVGLVG
jgi:hypothetical protein